jgi:hypothetical protein
MDKEKKIERLQAIIDKNADPKIVESAIAQLKMLETEGKVAIHNQAAGVTQDPDAQAILDALNKAISKGFTSGVDVRKEIEEVLKARKINETDLSDSLRALIQSSRKIELTPIKRTT